MRRAIAVSLGLSALAALGAVAAVPLALAPQGCAIHSCDYAFVDTEHDPGAVLKEGRKVDDSTWESNAVDERWLYFPGQREWLLNFPQFRGRRVVETHAYLSVDDQAGSFDANQGNANWAEASGNLAEFRPHVFQDSTGATVQNDQGILVKNDTCSNYYVRVVLTFAPVENAGAPSDAGLDGQTPVDGASGAPDGGTDGGADARLDAGVD